MRSCFYGWLIWAVVLAGQVSVFMGASSGLTFVVNPMRDDLQLSQTSIALAYTIGTAASALAQIPIGRSVDRWGGRVGVTAYSALFYLSVAALSLPSSFPELCLAFSLLRAFGVGGLELACNTCLQQWFARRRGFATGLLACIANVVSYAGVANLVAALVTDLGWRRTYTGVGLSLLTAFTPLAAVLLRSQPEDMGLLPDGDAPAPPSNGTRTSPGAMSHTVTAVPPKMDGNETNQTTADISVDALSAHAHLAAAHPIEAAAPERALGKAVSLHCDDSWTLREATRTRAFFLLAIGNAFAWGSEKASQSPPPEPCPSSSDDQRSHTG